MLRRASRALLLVASGASCAFQPSAGVFDGQIPQVTGLGVAVDGAAIVAMTDAVRVLGPGGDVIELSTSPDGRRRTPRWAGEAADRGSVAVVYDDAVIAFRGLRDMGPPRYEAIAVLELPGRFRAAAVNRRVNELAVATSAGLTRVPLPGLSPAVHTPLTDGAFAVAFDDAGQRLAYAESTSVSLLDLRDGAPRLSRTLAWTPAALAFDDRGARLGVGGKKLALWDLSDHSLAEVADVSDVRALAHLATLGSFAVCEPDGVKLCASSERCVDVAPPAPLTAEDSCRHLAAAPDGTALAVAGAFAWVDRAVVPSGSGGAAPDVVLRRSVVDGVIDVKAAR